MEKYQFLLCHVLNLVLNEVTVTQLFLERVDFFWYFCGVLLPYGFLT